MYMGANFTVDLITRYMDPLSVTPAVIDGSSIRINMDNTNQEISVTILQKTSEAFEVCCAPALCLLASHSVALCLWLSFCRHLRTHF
jgi:hypothetical protein